MNEWNEWGMDRFRYKLLIKKFGLNLGLRIQN